MKKSLIPLAAVILALVVTSAGVLALTGGDSRGDDHYRVTIQFDTSVTQEDIDEVAALLRTYDDNLEFVVMEIFPPIGSALLALEAPAECSTIEAQLEAKSYVANASCAPWQPVDLDDPDAPVDQDNEATDASCEPMPLRSDCGIDPNECNQVHNIDACDDLYGVTVQFNTSVTQDHIDEAAAFLRTFDDDLEFIIMEISPPIGSAVLNLETSDECSTIEAQLEAESYLASVSCEPWQPNGEVESGELAEQTN